MSLHCPRCDVRFEKDLPRCPACGWDFRAHILPETFLRPPLDFSPLRELPRFLLRNAGVVWVNGITVLFLWALLGWIVFRGTLLAWRLLLDEPPPMAYPVVLSVSAVLVTILFFPIEATYLFGLLRRYRYHVEVPLFAVFAPPGKSRYGESLAWAPLCLAVGAFLVLLLVVPGVTFLSIYVPFLLLMHLDKLNISRRRRRFILLYTFRRLILLMALTGFVLSACWVLICWMWNAAGQAAAIALCAFFFPLQSAFVVLFYESILGRVDLDPQ